MRTSSQDVGIDVVRFFTEKMSEWISSGFSAEKSRKRTKPELRQVIDLSKGTMRAKESQKKEVKIPDVIILQVM